MEYSSKVALLCVARARSEVGLCGQRAGASRSDAADRNLAGATGDACACELQVAV